MEGTEPKEINPALLQAHKIPDHVGDFGKLENPLNGGVVDHEDEDRKKTGRQTVVLNRRMARELQKHNIL